MLVDHERVVLRLKEAIASKRSHGQRDLLAEIARLEVECQIEEGLPERALRLYGVVFSDDLLRPAELPPREGAADGQTTTAPIGPGTTVPKEDTCQQTQQPRRTESSNSSPTINSKRKSAIDSSDASSARKRATTAPIVPALS